MKLSFAFTIILSNQLAFATARSFLDGEVQDSGVADSKPGDEMTDIAAEFKQALVPEQIKRVQTLKLALLPMFKSLPKNRQGNLVPQVARYALHRLFEQQHSWSVNGLSRARATVEKEDLFGRLVANVTSQGISIDNLALLAAILEDHIHKETVSQLTATYHALAHESSKEELSADELDSLIERYMTTYISGMREYNLTDREFTEQKRYMENATQDWNVTLNWIHQSEHDALRAKKPCGQGITDCTFDVQTTTYVIEELLKGYGQFNHGECTRLKNTLLAMEDRKAGRVPLSNFYMAGMSGTWEFNEKIDYLRDLGTLDESMPGQPHVIVVNYVNSWVNCLTSSSLYSVCCRNECEDLMGHLERRFESPTALPERILQLIRDFHSSDFPTAVNISELQYTRLHTIAENHQGTVPLHGRLFAQWLHHVFPRNCPYPHTAGATNPLTPDEWMKEMGHTAIKASHEEMMQVVANFQRDVAVDVKGGVRSGIVIRDLEEDQDSLPWSDVEEVFVIHSSQEERQPDSRFFGLDAMVMGLEAAISMGMVFAILHIAKGRGCRPNKKTSSLHAFEKLHI